MSYRLLVFTAEALIISVAILAACYIASREPHGRHRATLAMEGRTIMNNLRSDRGDIDTGTASAAWRAILAAIVLLIVAYGLIDWTRHHGGATPVPSATATAAGGTGGGHEVTGGAQWYADCGDSPAPCVTMDDVDPDGGQSWYLVTLAAGGTHSAPVMWLATVVGTDGAMRHQVTTMGAGTVGDDVRVGA